METQHGWFSVSPFRSRNGVADRELTRMLANMAVPVRPAIETRATGFAPVFELYEDGDQFIAVFEVPGLGISDIDVEVEPTSIRISGEKAKPDMASENSENSDAPVVLVAGRQWGAFERVIKLPVKVIETKAKATMKNGVLTVTLPKLVEQPKAKKLTIEDAS